MGKLTDKSAKNVHSGHRKRVRERFLQTGFYGFSEHQILEMLLFYIVPRRDTNVLAHRLLDRFGSLSAVLDADIPELKEFGLSENAAVLFRMIPAVTELYFHPVSNDMIYDSQDKLAELFLPMFSADRFELRIACFRNELSLITTKLLYAGDRYTENINSMTYSEYCDFCRRPEFGSFPTENVDFRRIAETALFYGSSNVVVAHNHLYNAPLPDEDELRTIKKLKELLSVLDITLLDYFLIGDGVSYNVRGNDIYGIFDCENLF